MAVPRLPKMTRYSVRYQLPTLIIFVGDGGGLVVVVVLRCGAEPAGGADLPDPGGHVLVGVCRQVVVPLRRLDVEHVLVALTTVLHRQTDVNLKYSWDHLSKSSLS